MNCFLGNQAEAQECRAFFWPTYSDATLLKELRIIDTFAIENGLDRVVVLRPRNSELDAIAFAKVLQKSKSKFAYFSPEFNAAFEKSGPEPLVEVIARRPEIREAFGHQEKYTIREQFERNTFSEPPSSRTHTAQNANNQILKSGMILEGSAITGALQPNYLLDFESSQFDALRIEMDRVKYLKITPEKKVKRILEYVKKEMLPMGSYTNESYLRLMQKHLQTGKPIPISHYVGMCVGVCRENAIIANYALNLAGIPARFQYVREQTTTTWWDRPKTEDHALNVFQLKGVNEGNWIADSYNSDFNGYNFDDLKSKNATDFEKPRRLSTAKARPDVTVQILETHRKFPKIWVSRSFECSGLLKLFD